MHAALHLSFLTTTVLAIGLELVLVQEALELFLIGLAGLLHRLHLLLHFAHLGLHLLHEFLTLLIAHGAEVGTFAVLTAEHVAGTEVQLLGILDVEFAHLGLLLGGQGVLLHHFLGTLDHPDTVGHGLGEITATAAAATAAALRPSFLRKQGNSAQHSRCRCKDS